MAALNELRPPCAIQFVVEGQGMLDPEALYDALGAAAAVNPGASLILEEGPTSDNWVLGPAPTLTVVDAPDFAAQGTEDAPFLRWRLDAKTGPTCELVYVTAGHRSYLIFRVLHAVMDGQGTLLWAKDVMRCLRGEAPIGHPSMLDVDTLFRAEIDNRRPQPKDDALHPIGPACQPFRGQYVWRRLRVDRPLGIDATGRVAIALAEQCHRNNQANQATGPVRIHLPTDLRAHCRDQRSTANMFGSLFIEVEPGSTAEKVSQRVMRGLFEHEGTKPAGLFVTTDDGRLDAYRVKVYMDLARLHEKAFFAFSATLSHLGRLDSASLSAEGWKAESALFVPLISDGIVVSLNGFDDHIEVTAGTSDRFDSDLFLGMMDAIKEGLLR
ncbi:MAG: hypothetical protein AAFN74_01765 [Myxococcota bacterium]